MKDEIFFKPYFSEIHIPQSILKDSQNKLNKHKKLSGNKSDKKLITSKQKAENSKLILNRGSIPFQKLKVQKVNFDPNRKNSLTHYSEKNHPLILERYTKTEENKSNSNFLVKNKNYISFAPGKASKPSLNEGTNNLLEIKETKEDNNPTETNEDKSAIKIKQNVLSCSTGNGMLVKMKQKFAITAANSTTNKERGLNRSNNGSSSFKNIFVKENKKKKGTCYNLTAPNCKDESHIKTSSVINTPNEYNYNYISAYNSSNNPLHQNKSHVINLNHKSHNEKANIAHHATLLLNQHPMLPKPKKKVKDVHLSQEYFVETEEEKPAELTLEDKVVYGDRKPKGYKKIKLIGK